jgi:cell division septation protein DedD
MRERKTDWPGLILIAALLASRCGGNAPQPPSPSQPSATPTTATKQPESNPPNAPQPPAAQTPTHFHFALQARAFQNRANAEALSLQLSGKYHRTTLVTPVEAGGRTFYRVRILVETKADADALSASLVRDEKISPWIIPLP